MENNRDLLIVSKLSNMSHAALQVEVDMLVHILYSVESLSQVCVATEIYDLNKYRTIRDPKKIAKFLETTKQKKFIFIGNKN
jgi:hypothetical protein